MKGSIAKHLEDLCLLPSLSGHEQLVSAGGVYTELYETQFKPRGIADHT